jgi:putative transposase
MSPRPCEPVASGHRAIDPAPLAHTANLTDKISFIFCRMLWYFVKLPSQNHLFMKAPFYEIGGVYFVTLTVVGWTDIFIRSEYRDEIIHNLAYCQQYKGLRIYSFCLMTNHLHMIASSENGLLNAILSQFKSFTAKQLIHMVRQHPKESRKEFLLNRFAYMSNIRQEDSRFQFWERDNYPEQILTDAFYLQKEHYIHMNPVRAGLVLRPEDWLHSSACLDCPLEIFRGDLVTSDVG